MRIVSSVFLLLLFLGFSTQAQDRVLVFSKTAGYYHESIPSGISAIQKLGAGNGFLVDTTKNAALFSKKNLKKYSAVVFLSTTLDILNGEQQAVFQMYIENGGGFVGIHAAADTEYDWPWYNQLVGAYFNGHPNNPNVRAATIQRVDSLHASMRNIPLQWARTDEWYNYRDFAADLTVLANLDESSYEGGTNGENHPIAWYHSVKKGRAFYTGGGHTDAAYSEPLFLAHLLGGIQYAIGR